MNIFKKYVDYLKDNPNKLWFKRKLYGWGWTPATKEGWFVTLIYIVLIISLSLTIDENSSTKETMLILVLPFVLLTIAFIRIAYKKGEKPYWSWGMKSNNKIKEEEKENKEI